MNNAVCAVYHADGKCPGYNIGCTCGADSKTTHNDSICEIAAAEKRKVAEIDVKAFIRKTRQEAYTRGRRDAVEYIKAHAPQLDIAAKADKLYVGILDSFPDGTNFIIAPDTVLAAAQEEGNNEQNSS